MIHEILFSVWHCPSDIFSKDENEWISLELKEFLHPGECEQLKRVMRLACTYYKIVEFQELVANKQTIQDASFHGNEDGDSPQEDITYGLYMKAFCNGLDEALEDYKNEIIKLESTVLKFPHLNLNYVVSSLQRYLHLFEALNAMIRTVKVEHISGCLLIGRLHLYTLSGIPQITEAANKIMRSINTMFYRHLATWIVYGDLVDVYKEFFIEDCNCDDVDFLYPEQIEAGQGELDNSSAGLKKSRVKKPWRIRKFAIKTRMLPSTIPIETAETILFMGRTVWILHNDPNRNYDVLQEKFKRDVWEGASVECYRQILNMEKSTFNLQMFERTITNCRLRLTKYLWKVMVEEAQLLEHLQLFRDYYALGRGELFQQFIVIADKQMKQTVNAYYEKNLNAIFNETARKIYTENDRSYQKFELALSRDFDSKNDDPLLSLELYVDISWPLHIIFHPKVMSLYNQLFGFLLRVKKTHINLHNVWLNQMAGKNKMDRAVWTLRHNLMFLVNNIQYYLQVDVIEAQFSILKEAVRNANEFNDIFRLHSTFLSNLLSRTFVMIADEKSDEQGHHKLYQLPSLKNGSINMVYHTILKLLELCDKFCLLASVCDVTELTEMQFDTFGELQKNCDFIIETLLRELYSLHKQVSGSHLLQLLHRIDFNMWYTKTRPDLNISAL